MERISHREDDYKIKFTLPKQWAFWLKWAVPILLALWLLSGIYIVRPDEQGVVRRFGEVVRTTEPGPHYRLPLPIEKVSKPRIQQVRRIKIALKPIVRARRQKNSFRPLIS